MPKYNQGYVPDDVKKKIKYTVSSHPIDASGTDMDEALMSVIEKLPGSLVRILTLGVKVKDKLPRRSS